MRRMHNYMKESEAFHQEPEGMVEIRFKPKSRWLVFADMAGHSCLSGEFAMINRFHGAATKFPTPGILALGNTYSLCGGKVGTAPGYSVRDLTAELICGLTQAGFEKIP